VWTVQAQEYERRVRELMFKQAMRQNFEHDWDLRTEEELRRVEAEVNTWFDAENNITEVNKPGVQTALKVGWQRALIPPSTGAW
jgi:hypothetical protein